MKRAVLAVMAFAGFCLAVEPAKAAVITLDFTVKGSFSQGGLNNGSGGAGPGNTLMGENTGGLLNAYWGFDLAGITGPVVSATLRLGMPPFGYLSPDPTETITIFDYTGDIGVLQDQFAHSTAAFNDLGSGNVYGSRAVSDADEPDCSSGCPGSIFSRSTSHLEARISSTTSTPRSAVCSRLAGR